jgi:hypothetical protein
MWQEFMAVSARLPMLRKGKKNSSKTKIFY